MTSAVQHLQSARPQLLGVHTDEEAPALTPLQLLHAGPHRCAMYVIGRAR